MSGSTPRANPLTEGEIGAVLGRMGLLASGDRLRCVPLDGGVSSDIWRIEIGARKYCLKRALAQLKVSQFLEAPIGGIHSGSPGGAGGDRLFHGGGPHAAR